MLNCFVKQESVFVCVHLFLLNCWLITHEAAWSHNNDLQTKHKSKASMMWRCCIGAGKDITSNQQGVVCYDVVTCITKNKQNDMLRPKEQGTVHTTNLSLWIKLQCCTNARTSGNLKIAKINNQKGIVLMLSTKQKN